MSISDELQKLEALLERGILTREEFQKAKERVLTESAVGGPADQLEEIRAQNRVAQLDREWDLERETYMVNGKYGRHLPSRVGNVVGGLLAVGFGIFWTIMAVSMEAPFFMPIFGVVFVTLGAVGSIHGFYKAGLYQSAQASYQRRRQDLLNEQRGI